MHSQRISLTVLITLVTANVSTVPVKLPVPLSSPQVLAQTTDTSAQVQNTQDRRQEALRRRLFDKGKQQYRKGQFRSALKTFRRGLVIVRTIGDRQDEAKISNYIGLINHNLGQELKALNFYQQGLAISQEVGDRYSEAAALNTIGEVYTRLRQYPKALDVLQQGEVISREIGDRACSRRHR